MGLSIFGNDVNRVSGVLVFFTTLLAFVVGWITFDLTAEDERLQMVIRALGVGAIVVIIFAVCEALGIRPITQWLNSFRSTVPFVDVYRVISTLDHPNSLAMYLELTLPFVIVWLVTTQCLRVRLMLMSVLVLGTLMMVLSLSRGGMVSFAVALLLFAIVAFRMGQRFQALINIAMVAGLCIMLMVQSVLMPRLMVRLTSEGSNAAWYNAIYDAPAYIQAAPDETLSIAIKITNTGLITWHTTGQQPVNLAYHMICPGGLSQQDFNIARMPESKYLVTEGPRTGLPQVVPRGETVDLNVTMTAPSTAGTYWIAWDLIQESVTWFSDKGLQPAITVLEISGDKTALSCNGHITRPDLHDQPSRLVLWETALRIIGDHSLVGVGTRNFPVYFQKYTAITLATPPPHPHNLYLALLVDYGVFSAGFIVMAALLLWRLWAAAKPAETDSKQHWAIWFAIGIALMSFAFHNAVESFYYQPSIILTTCVIVGLLARFSITCHKQS